MKVRIGRAKKIAGWMSPKGLRWLARRARGCERIIEVGVHRGRTTRVLLDNSEAHVWCVDSWAGARARHEQVFTKNIRKGKGRVTVMAMSSLAAARSLGRSHGPVFDMVFIDASHEYAGVRADILAYRKLVRPGGLLCGHDYSRRSWPGVVRAVNELVPNKQRGAGLIWWVKV